jgi:hypothetical protein
MDTPRTNLECRFDAQRSRRLERKGVVVSTGRRRTAR